MAAAAGFSVVLNANDYKSSLRPQYPQMAHQSEPTGASHQPSKLEEASSSATISRIKTVTKRGRQVKAQFRALFQKKDSLSDVAHQQDQPKDVTQTTATSLIVGGKNKDVVVGVQPIGSKTTSDKALKTNIIVTTATTATVTSSLNSSKTASTVPAKPPRPTSSQLHHHKTQKPPPTDFLPSTNTDKKPRTQEETEIASLRAALSSALKRKQSLESRLAKADLTTHKLTRKSEILTNSLCRANTDFESTRQTLQDTIDSLRAEISRLGDVEMLLMKEQSRVRALKHSVEKRDREVEDLNSRLGRTDGKVRVLRGEVSRLRGERDRVRRENERLWAIVGVERLNLRTDRDRDRDRAGEEEEEEDESGEYVGAGEMNQNWERDRDRDRDRGDGKDREGTRREDELLGRNLKKGGEDEVCNLSGMTEARRHELRKERVRRWIGDRMPGETRKEGEK